MADCIFCKIVAGDIPCHRIHENDRVLSFLDIGPLSRGHSLIIPKQHHETLMTMPDDLAAACMEVVAQVGRAVAKATGKADWNVLQNNGAASGQEVPHVHFHVIPRCNGDGLGYRWKPAPLDSSEAQDLLSAITAEL